VEPLVGYFIAMGSLLGSRSRFDIITNLQFSWQRSRYVFGGSDGWKVPRTTNAMNRQFFGRCLAISFSVHHLYYQPGTHASHHKDQSSTVVLFALRTSDIPKSRTVTKPIRMLYLQQEDVRLMVKPAKHPPPREMVNLRTASQRQ
jgi:hypothetical protein